MSTGVPAGRARLIAVLYGTALLQGIALVSFPAAGNVLRDPRKYALGASEYGALFVPMFAVAALAALAAGRFVARFGLAALYRAGVLANAASMLLFAVSAFFVANKGQAHALLVAALACEGLGFGATITALNGQVQRLFARGSARALTSLHALLGVGTALPPLLLPLASAAGGFWLLPLLAGAALLVAVLAYGAPRSPPSAAAELARAPGRRPSLLPVASLAAGYGFAEATIGGFGTLYLHEERGLTLAAAGAALSAFWGSVTAGRLLLAAAARVVPPLRVLPFLPLALALGLFASSRFTEPVALLLAFACAGLGGSAILPLSIELGGRGASDPERRAGAVFATFLAGSALGSVGVGMLRDAEISLAGVFALVSLLALALALAAQRAARGGDALVSSQPAGRNRSTVSP